VDNLLESNLDNDIHPISQYDNWVNIPPNLYKVSEPSLKLVTLFISTDEMLNWWIAIDFGEIQSDSSGKSYIKFDSDHTQQQQYLDTVKSTFLKFAKEKNATFGFLRRTHRDQFVSAMVAHERPITDPRIPFTQRLQALLMFHFMLLKCHTSDLRLILPIVTL